MAMPKVVSKKQVLIKEYEKEIEEYKSNNNLEHITDEEIFTYHIDDVLGLGESHFPINRVDIGFEEPNILSLKEALNNGKNLIVTAKGPIEDLETLTKIYLIREQIE